MSVSLLVMFAFDVCCCCCAVMTTFFRRFCSSHMWRKQGLLRAPEMISEAEFQRPANWSHLKSNELKPSYGDHEETAQWLTGDDFFHALLEALIGHIKEKEAGIVWHNVFAYDAVLEKSVLSRPVAQSCPFLVLSWAQTMDLQSYVRMQLTQYLIEQWKNRSGPLFTNKKTDQYLPWDGDAVVQPVAQPQLKICKLVDSILTIPQDIRAKYLVDAVRSHTWKELLRKFDSTYNVPLAGVSAAAAVAAADQSEAATDSAGGGTQEVPHHLPADWFPGEPTTVEELKQYKQLTAFDHSNSTSHFVMMDDGGVHKLFLVATRDSDFSNEEYIVGHGAGSWLQADKAVKHCQDQPGKSHAVNWQNDAALCVLEGSSGDSAVKTLRQCLHDVESSGLVNFELAGHTLERPADVLNGTAPDKCPSL